MNKFLTKVAKIFLGLSMAAGVGLAVGTNVKQAAPVKAETANLSFSDLYSETTNVNGVALSIASGVTVTFNKGSGNNDPMYYTSGTAVRLYAKGTIVVKSTVGNITAFTLTYGSSDGSNSFTASTGTWSTANWSGNAATITLTEGGANGNRRIAGISVTYTATASPSITLSKSSLTGYTGQTLSSTATYSNLTSDFAWGSPTGSGTVTTTTSSSGNARTGSSTINATLTGGGTVNISATGGGATSKTLTISITQTTLNITKASTSIGQSRSETLEFTHNASSVDGVTWSSNNAKVTVDNGTVSVAADAPLNSTAIITATSKVDASVSDTCTVTVVETPLDDYDYTIGQKTFDSGDLTKSLSTSYYNPTWTLSPVFSTGSYYGYESTRGQQIGSSGSPCTSATLTTSSFSNGIASIVIYTSGHSQGTVSVTVGGNSYGGNAQSYTSSNTGYTFNKTGATAPTGEIVISWTNATRALYFKEIVITFEKVESQFTVTYDANGATSGTAPEDTNKYTGGDEVTVLDNSVAQLAKTDWTWNGWNTSDDGSGTHYDANDTFEISGSITLYAEWVKTLDAISSISGSVSSTLSKAGTYDWDFSNISVTGTISGVTGQDIKNYVDLSSGTVVPSTIGSCTVSITATKKSTIPGSATSLTNGSVSGDVEAPKLVYSFTITEAKLLQTGISYANENAHAKSSTATCSEHDDIEIAWASNQIMKNGSDIQFQTTNGYLYNTTEIPGTITNVSVTATAQSFNVYYGDSEHPTSETTPGGKYFTVQGVGSTPKASQIVVTFEVSDKPKVQLVASDINVDVADGAATPTITDGSAAVTGYTLVSDDSHIASITNDGKVQPVGYGHVIINVTKAEDAGHIYLATTFTVTVGDHSKEVSKMEFVEKADGSTTADDGVVWTIDSGSITENDYSDVYGINFGTNGSKISALTLTAPADEERIIKNVVVEAMSAADGSSIGVTVGSTSFTCSKTPTLIGSTTTFNFSGNTSGAITITMSGTQSPKYGVKSISVLYVGDEATSFASTFLGAIACNAQGTSKPTFTKQSDGVTSWSWSLLKDEFDELSLEDKAKFAKGATGVSSTITECVERYDYIVGKYYVGGLDTTLISSDFMGRSPSAIGAGGAPLLLAANINNTNTIAIIVIISMVSVGAIGGYFFIRKRKENI